MTAVGEGFAANLASEVSKGLFILAKRHASYCFHFRKYIEDFQNELENFESTRNDALKLEKSAKDNNKEIPDAANIWFGKANDLIKASKELKNKIGESSKCIIGWCPNCTRRYGLGKKAISMTEKLKKHSIDFKSIDLSHPAPRLGMEFYAPKFFIDLESREVAHDKLWKALEDDQKLRVGLYGMGGSGKTTLVKKIGYNAEEKKLFQKVVFVVVSNPPDVRKIQENIASQLGLKFENNQESDRARELFKRLINGEKILIILDDVWEKLDLNVIGIPFEDKHKDCRILLTTRDLDICNSMDCQLNIELPVLSEEDSWNLFKRYANINDDSSTLLDVAKKLATKCKGLPIAIITIASTLKDIEPQEWENALTTLTIDKPLIGIDDNLIGIYHCLKLSYANLKSKEVQELFLLCSFFPEDYEIPVEVLTRYAMGLHLFGDYRSITKARKLAFKAKRTLINSCLLLNVESNKGEYVKMHDLVREVAQWIANKEIKEIGSKFDDDALDRSRYLWLSMTTDLPSQLNYPRPELARISIKTNYMQISSEKNKDFFTGLDKLHVLDLSPEYASRYYSSKFSHPIPVLKSLRMLRMEYCILGDISIIESLKSLEILELLYCDIDELPSGMVELKNLKLLDLSDCNILQNPLKVIGRLMQLEELYYSIPYSPESSWMVDGRNISEFLPENCQLTKLIRYHIQLETERYGHVDSLILRSFSIRGFDPSKSNETIKNIVRRAEYLYLVGIEGGFKNIVPELTGEVGGKIQCVNIRLENCNDIECLIDSTIVSSQDASMLSALVELEVEEMHDLKALCHGTPPSNIFKKLRRLCLGECPVLTSLLTLSVALNLELLEELKISTCARLEHVIAHEREWEKEDFNQKISWGSFFGKLKIVTVIACDNLKFIFPISLARRLIQLEEIIIYDAAELEHIFGLYQDEGEALRESDKEIMLPSLHEIELEEVPSFESIFPMYSHPKDYPEVEATDLEATTPVILNSSHKNATTWCTSVVQCLPKKLANICHIRCGSQVEVTALDTTTSKELHASQNTDTRLLPHLSAVQYCFPRPLNMCYVRKMTLFGLSTKVVSLFTLSNAQMMLVERLTIRNCNGLKHIITNGEVDFNRKSCVSIFPELQYLYVENCKLLEFILSAGSAQCPPKLESLTILDAPELKSVFGQCYNDNHLYHQNENVMNIMEPASITSEAILRHDNMLNIKHLVFLGSGVEGIFMMEGVVMNEQQHQLITRLEWLSLCELPELTYICRGPQQCLSFQNLTYVRVTECGKLRCLFSVSVVRSLPQLDVLIIKSCNELEQIVEDDDSQNVCFPNLSKIIIGHCDKLKYIFFISQSNFPELACVDISNSCQLEEVFRWRRDETQDKDITLLPKLETLRLGELPCLTNVYQGFNFDTVGEVDVFNCPQLSPTYKNDVHKSKSVDLDEEGVSASHGGESSKPFTSPHFENIDQSEHDPPSKELSPDNVFSDVESEKTESKNDTHLNMTTFLGTQGTMDQSDVQVPLNVSPDPNELNTYAEDVLDVEHVADTFNPIAASGIVENDHPMADVNPPSAPVPFLAIMPHDLASLVNNVDDVELVSTFLASHSDVVFPAATLPSIFRQSGYQTLITLLKLFRSHSALELVCNKKNLLIEHLDALKCYGFAGPWLESLLNHLQCPHALLDPKELHDLIRTEESYSSQQSCLKKHIDELNSQLVDVETKLKEISVKKKIYEDACVGLESYFHF